VARADVGLLLLPTLEGIVATSSTRMPSKASSLKPNPALGEGPLLPLLLLLLLWLWVPLKADEAAANAAPIPMANPTPPLVTIMRADKGTGGVMPAAVSGRRGDAEGMPRIPTGPSAGGSVAVALGRRPDVGGEPMATPPVWVLRGVPLLPRRPLSCGEATPPVIATRVGAFMFKAAGTNPAVAVRREECMGDGKRRGEAEAVVPTLPVMRGDGRRGDAMTVNGSPLTPDPDPPKTPPPAAGLPPDVPSTVGCCAGPRAEGIGDGNRSSRNGCS
jgi:hypothetical protein